MVYIINSTRLKIYQGMTTNNSPKPDPEKMAFLRQLPLNIKEQLTGKEVEQFLYNT